MKKETETIPDQVLKKYDARVIKLEKGQSIFREGEAARAFFIVKRGQVKMVSLSRGGKEFVQGYFTEGQSFGEPPFFTAEPYPAAAIAVVPTEIWKIGRTNFLRLLRNNFEIHLAMTRALGLRLIYKSIMLSELAIEKAGHRITTLLRHLKETGQKDDEVYIVPFSRQELADMAGLRVETVIRIIKNLESRKIVKLRRDGKIIPD
jgi:CRP/FNR family cyclic AMP-dependent transcriptional regulator